MTNYRSSSPVVIATAAQLMLLCTLGIIARAQTAPQNPAPATDQTEAPGTAPTGTAPTSGGELQTVTVTGYLIPRVGEGPQPVTTLNQDFIQKQAYQTVNDVLNNYPGGLSGQNAQTFAGNSNSPATSAFNLKSLPIGSTLVLIDGFRFPSTAIQINGGTIPFVDINAIPLASIDRIEILKDGGSATYGDDAIAGVVNIITKEDYNGADIINYFGESQRGDDEIYHLSMTGGASQKGLSAKSVSLPRSTITIRLQSIPKIVRGPMTAFFRDFLQVSTQMPPSPSVLLMGAISILGQARPLSPPAPLLL